VLLQFHRRLRQRPARSDKIVHNHNVFAAWVALGNLNDALVSVSDLVADDDMIAALVEECAESLRRTVIREGDGLEWLALRGRLTHESEQHRHSRHGGGDSVEAEVEAIL
jgi:hypothetical protein